MASDPTDTTQVAQEQLNRAKAKAKAFASVATDFNISGWLQDKGITDALKDHITLSSLSKDAIDIGMSLASSVLGAMFTVISKFRHEVTHTFDDTAVEVVNEFLGTELDASVMQTGKGGDETIRKANAIGGAVLDRLEQEFTGGKPANPESGAAAARTFTGYG